MKTKEYVKKYKLNVSDKFNHSEFVSDLSLDFLSLLEVGKAQENIKGFENAVRAIRMKYDAINNKTVGNIPEKLWKYFYASVIVKFRDELFPEVMEQRKIEKEEREQRRKYYEEIDRDMFAGSFFYSLISELFKIEIPESSFKTLELDSDSNVDDVKKQYRKLSLVHHPDKKGNQNKFIQITEAKNKCLSYLATK